MTIAGRRTYRTRGRPREAFANREEVEDRVCEPYPVRPILKRCSVLVVRSVGLDPVAEVGAAADLLRADNAQQYRKGSNTLVSDPTS